MTNIKTRNYFILIFVLIFLTNVHAEEALSISKQNNTAKNYLTTNYSQLGVSLKDVQDAKIQNSYQSKHNGLTHIYFRQHLNGIEMLNADMQIHLDKKGEVFRLHNQFVPSLADKVTINAPKITAIAAIESALKSLNLTKKQGLYLISKDETLNQSANYSNAGVSLANIPAKLVYNLNSDNKPRLAWDLQIQLNNAWRNIIVDALDGSILASYNWTVNDSYSVFPQPFESPEANGASHQIVSNVADAIASPFGWHDTNGAVGAEFTDTRGNNVSAQDDLDANNSGGSRPDGGVALDFDFTFDPAMQPDEGENLQVGIVNLFYWNNVIHDIMYQYGFDESSGNFQVNNYGNGGQGNDSVNADAQDGSGNNNANFSTPPDGFNPRMQMFQYFAPPDLEVNSPLSIAGNYAIAGAGFGSRFTEIGTTAILEEVNDNTDTASDACEPLVGFTAGRIALLDRGNCEFGIKVLNAEQAGAIAAMVINNQGDALTTMGPGANGAAVTIPSAFIGQTDGNTIRAELANNVEVTLSVIEKDRDGDLDNAIVIHEYGHGISNRLTGGPGNTSCLNNQEQMGEGWSDYFAMALTAQASDQATDARAMGTYAGNNLGGIREFPYTTDQTINLHTFTDIASVSVPHGVGSVWAEMLWEVYWNLVTDHGFDDDIYNGSGGNNLALQLVIDGLKLQECNPSFVQGRDAIIAADVANNAGANSCAIWRGFAKRGLGVNASSGNNNVLGDETQDFSVPAACVIDLIFAHGFESL